MLGNYANSETDALSDILAIAEEAGWQAKGDDVRFINDVALRLAEG